MGFKMSMPGKEIFHLSDWSRKSSSLSIKFLKHTIVFASVCWKFIDQLSNLHISKTYLLFDSQGYDITTIKPCLERISQWKLKSLFCDADFVSNQEFLNCSN